MNLIEQIKGNEVPTILYAVIFIITFIVLAANIILLWVNFLPKMQEAADETDRLLGESDKDKSFIDGKAISKIRFAYIFYLICFGILDGILAFMLWRGKVPKEKGSVVKIIANSYVLVMFLNYFILTMLSIIAVVGSYNEIALNLLYASLVLFSMVSLFYIIYFKKKILINNQ